MNCYAFFLLGIVLSIYFLSKNVTIEANRGRGGRGHGGGIGGFGHRGGIGGFGHSGGYYGGRGGYYGGRGGYYGGRGGYYGGSGVALDINPLYIYDDDKDYYQYPYWYRYIPFFNYY